MKQKLIIDADPGLGDALGIALALFDPELDVVAITATAGSVSGAKATENIESMIAALDPPKWPRLGACDDPIPSIDSELLAEAVRPAAFNGPTGLGNWSFPTAGLHHRHESEKVLVDIVRTYPNEITLLTLGPLTNIERACEREPDFLQMIQGIVCLGGSVSAGGDITAAAEFNIYAEPEAARKILCSRATKTLVPLDIANKVLLTFDQFDRMPKQGTTLAKFVGDILPFAFRAYHEHLGLESLRIPAVAALAAISRPEGFEQKPMVLDIETSGELTRGMTVFDRRNIDRWQTNIDVLTKAETQSIVDYFNGILKRASE